MKTNLILLSVFIISLVMALFWKKKILETEPKPSQHSNPISAPVSPPRVSPNWHQHQGNQKHIRDHLFEIELKHLTEKALQVMPTIHDLKELSSEEVHHTPDIILKEGQILGEIAQLIEDHPELGKQAIDFYEKCAKNADAPTSIRALCYFRFKKLDPNHENREDDSIPDSIKILANQLD
jgi:hypothetical protein